jgi:hypothetical protein
MGAKEILRKEAPKEVSGLTSINNVLEQEDYEDMLQDKSSQLRPDISST